jgi:PST family polysaccharide transporter
MLHFGGTLTLNGLVIYLGYNAEKVLLGRFWGADVLGIYGRAYSLINLPMQQLHSSINAVAFPALSRIQREPERLCSSFLKAYSVLLSLSIPATLCCLLFADEVIPVVLGPKWAAAIPILQLLGPTVLALGFINPFGQFLNATGRVGRSLKIALLIAPLVIIGIAIGIPYGAIGVALGYSTVMMCLVLPVITWATHGSGITLGSVFRAARPPILAGVVAGLAGFAFEVAFTEVMPLLPRVIIELGLVGGLYIWMLLIVLGQKELYADLVRHLLQRDRPNP